MIEAIAEQSIEILISLDSTGKAVSTLNLMPLTSILVGFRGAIHLDTMYVLEPMYNFVQISCFSSSRTEKQSSHSSVSTFSIDVQLEAYSRFL
ncbi:hypothetical protein N7516_001701 [Penicillium verrucosum]|uniref:uncharacterized protein n=1 Tax=Penicillium verrucosum TaxID=60171 RepID=UPI0025454D1D|nr:uncharacterized protein N7516_001701 [Penicillium verrucosum]KAJ5941533.1 hypothetical protein N7516_001701 [Penicillium verrucosum]